MARKAKGKAKGKRKAKGKMTDEETSARIDAARRAIEGGFADAELSLYSLLRKSDDREGPVIIEMFQDLNARLSEAFGLETECVRFWDDAGRLRLGGWGVDFRAEMFGALARIEGWL